jgi:hypothetical protein
MGWCARMHMCSTCTHVHAVPVHKQLRVGALVGLLQLVSLAVYPSCACKMAHAVV